MYSAITRAYKRPYTRRYTKGAIACAGGIERLRDEAESLRQKPDNAPLPPVQSKAASRSLKLTDSKSWLTVGEAFDIAASRGFVKSKRTFQRLISSALATTVMSPELKQVGLIANWQKRREANPNDHSVRWLRF